MKVSGFYMINGADIEDVNNKAVLMFNDEIKPHLDRIYGKNTFKVDDTVKAEDFYDDETGKSYDVHFILDIPEVDFEEEAAEFGILESLMCCGLGIYDESEYYLASSL